MLTLDAIIAPMRHTAVIDQWQVTEVRSTRHER